MSRERVALDLAGYLDSPHAGRQRGVSAAQERGALEQFLQVAYEELGKAPNLLDGQELHELLGHRLPARFARRDPVVPHVPALIGRYYDHLEETVALDDAFAVRQALERTAPEFIEAATSGRAASHGLPPTAPIVNRAPKLGRNDPCWCGSGRKFKKCHGAAG